MSQRIESQKQDRERDPAASRAATGYLHGFTAEEQERLRGQARIIEHRIHGDLPFGRSRRLLEPGCGVGAQTETLLRYFPDLHVTGVDASVPNLEAARAKLASQPWLAGRFDYVHGDASELPFPMESFDGAFICWLLEHVSDPALVLSEVRRCLRPGSPVVVNEVQNASFFLSPYSPHTLSYWAAFNDLQWELGGDPFVGAKLGNLLLRVGYRDVQTIIKTIHLDSRRPGERAEFLEFWSNLLLSGCQSLLDAGRTTPEAVEGMKKELRAVGRDPDAVFFYSFIQARAVV
ncbi:MAG: methyltransferase domain-containing protein [Planctomycetota bacterium]